MTSGDPILRAERDIADEKLFGWRLALLIVALALGNVIALSNVPGYTALVPYAAGSLQGVNPSFGTWGTTHHMMGIVLGLPIARWLAARYGDYRVYARAFICYAFFSLLCAQSETIWFFTPARFLLGLTGGVILPLGQGIALNEFPENRRTLCVALWAALSMAPFTLGVFMGGFWAEYFNWRMLFYSNIILGLPIAGFVAALLHGRTVVRRIVRFDAIGFFLLLVVLVGAQTMLNQGNDFDWFGSPFLMLTLVVVTVATPLFVFWEFGERTPVLDLRLFARRNYAVAVACSIAGFLIIQGTLSVFIGQLQTLIGNSSSLAGAIYLFMAILAVPLVSIVHEIVRDIDLRLVACINFVGFAVVLSWLGRYDKLASFDEIALPMIFFGFFLGTFFAPLAAMGVQDFSGVRAIRAAEELTMLRTAAGALGIASQAVVQFRRAPFHQLGLADQLGGRRYPSLDLLQNLTDKLTALGMSDPVAKSLIARLVRQQSLLLGLDDIFYFGAVVFAILAAVVWFARGPGPRAAPPTPKTIDALAIEELTDQPY